MPVCSESGSVQAPRFRVDELTRQEEMPAWWAGSEEIDLCNSRGLERVLVDGVP